MKKAIPLTGSSTVVASDPYLEKFRAALRKQLLKVARTHPVASTRALFKYMADGNVMPRSGTEGRIEPVAIPAVVAAPAPVPTAPAARRAPPPRPTFKRPTALPK